MADDLKSLKDMSLPAVKLWLSGTGWWRGWPGATFGRVELIAWAKFFYQPVLGPG